MRILHVLLLLLVILIWILWLILRCRVILCLKRKLGLFSFIFPCLSFCPFSDTNSTLRLIFMMLLNNRFFYWLILSNWCLFDVSWDRFSNNCLTHFIDAWQINKLSFILRICIQYRWSLSFLELILKHHLSRSRVLPGSFSWFLIPCHESLLILKMINEHWKGLLRIGSRWLSWCFHIFINLLGRCHSVVYHLGYSWLISRILVSDHTVCSGTSSRFPW